MVCKAVHFWNLRDLVGAFVDLAIAYLLLCAAAIAFLATKFLGFFGLSLPCPCNGLFFNKNYFLQRLLFDYPTESISNVQLSVKQKFPFNDSLWRKNVNNDVNGILEMEVGASCCSVSDAKRAGNVVRRELSARDEKYDVKGKGVLNYKPRSEMHLRRKGDVGHGKYSSVSSILLCVDGFRTVFCALPLALVGEGMKLLEVAHCLLIAQSILVTLNLTNCFRQASLGSSGQLVDHQLKVELGGGGTLPQYWGSSFCTGFCLLLSCTSTQTRSFHS